MTRTRILIALSAVAAGAVVALFGGLTGRDAPDTPAALAATPQDTAILSQLLTGLSGTDTEAYVAKLERRLATKGHDRDTLLLLGLAYQQRARETGDARFFTLSGRALDEARTFRGGDGLAETGLASLAVSRHRFQRALGLAREALRVDPDNATALGALGDSFLNLGRYHKAFVAYDRMALLSPSVASYTMVAPGRELIGRPRAAISALR